MVEKWKGVITARIFYWLYPGGASVQSSGGEIFGSR